MRSGGTLAIYMGGCTLGAAAASLIAAGLSAATPCVAANNASLPGKRRVFADIADIAGRMVDADGPTLVLVGEVVACAARLVRIAVATQAA